MKRFFLIAVLALCGAVSSFGQDSLFSEGYKKTIIPARAKDSSLTTDLPSMSNQAWVPTKNGWIKITADWRGLGAKKVFYMAFDSTLAKQFNVDSVLLVWDLYTRSFKQKDAK